MPSPPPFVPRRGWPRPHNPVVSDPVRHRCENRDECLRYAAVMTAPAWPGWTCPIDCHRLEEVKPAGIEPSTGSGLSGACVLGLTRIR